MGKTIRKNDKRSGNQPANHNGSKKPHMQPEKHQKYKNFDDIDPDELEEREEHYRLRYEGVRHFSDEDI